jgi:hypothetical protein
VVSLRPARALSLTSIPSCEDVELAEAAGRVTAAVLRESSGACGPLLCSGGLIAALATFLRRDGPCALDIAKDVLNGLGEPERREAVRAGLLDQLKAKASLATPRLVAHARAATELRGLA